MANKTTLVLCLASVVFLCSVISAFVFGSKCKTGPIVGLLPVTVDMGVGEPGTILAIGVPFANLGDAPLVVSDIVAECGCTDVAPKAPFTILPGEKKQIQVGVRIDFKETEKTTSVTFMTNIPGHKDIGFGLHAKARRSIITSPSIASFPAIRFGRSISQDLELLKQDGSRWDNIRDLHVTIREPWLGSEIILNDRGHPILRLHLKSDAPAGVLSTKIGLHVSGDPTETGVPVNAYVKKTLVTVPSGFDPDELRESNAPRISFLVKRNDGESLGRYLRANLPKFVYVKESTQTSVLNETTVRRFEISVTRDFSRDRSHAEQIQLWFDRLDDPATIAVRWNRSGDP